MRVSERTKELLDELKARKASWKASYDQVISEALSVYADPRQAIAAFANWVLDIREDVKEIRKRLSELCEVLRSLLKVARGRNIY